MGREAKINKKLTTKQTIFVREIIKGSNATQAALTAYQTDKVNSAKVIGSRLLTNVNVRAALKRVLGSQGLTPPVITRNLAQIANSKPEKISGDTVLNANVVLLKLMGAYPSKMNPEFNFRLESKVISMSYEEAKEEFKRLQTFSKGLLVD